MATIIDNSQVNKIYDIRLLGYDSVHPDLQQLVKDFQAITAAKKELNALKGTVLSASELKNISDRLKELNIQQENIVRSTKSGTDATDKATGAYLALVKQYKEAKATAQDLGAELGIESEQFKAATVAAESFRAQIAAINTTAKNASIITEVLPTRTAEGDNVDLANAQFSEEFEKRRIEEGLFTNELIVNKEAIFENTVATEQATGAIDVQTQALRTNIASQIENELAIKANKTEQAAIYAEIKKTGAATDEQVQALAALRGEQLKIVESNKLLTTEIRNQAKEIIAENGSLEEQRAILNQLKVTFAQLGETEQNSPFGKQRLDEIKALNDKILDLETAQGVFNRQVGNYPQLFQNAFIPLSKELDTINAKLTAGGLGEAELADLTAKQSALNGVLALGAKEFASTTAQANAYKEANRQVGLTFGTNSAVFQNFSKEVAAGTNQIKNVDVEIQKATGNTNKLGAGFKASFGFLRTVANILPGIGIAGLIGLLLVPLEAIGSAFVSFVSDAFKGVGALKDFKKEYEETGKALSGGQSAFVKATVEIESLRISVNLAKDNFISKQKVVDQYNETIGQATKKVTSLSQVEDFLTNSAENYVKAMLFKAAANIALENSAKKVFEAEETRRKKETEFAKFTDRLGVTPVESESLTGGNLQQQKDFDEALKRQREKRREDTAKAADEDSKLQLSIAAKFQKDAEAAAKAAGIVNLFGKKKDIKDTADKLNVAEQNALKSIEANRSRLLAIENTNANEIEKVRKLSFDEEVTHLLAVQKINVDALNAKQALIQKDKTLNTEQARSIAEFGEQRSSLELQTSQKIQTLRKKQFEDINKDLEASLAAQKLIIENAVKEAQANPALSNEEKALIKVSGDNQILQLEQKHLADLAKLNDDYNKEAIIKTRLEAEKAAEAVRQGRALIAQAELKDIQAQGDATVNAINIAYSKQAVAILENEQLTIDKKKELLTRLSKSENITVLSAELATLNLEVIKEKELLDKNLINNEDYLATLKKQQKKAEELTNATSTNTESKNPIAKLFGFKSGSAEEKGVAEVTQAAYQLATEAMNGFFDAERNRIEQSLKLAEARIEADRKVALSQSQSAAETDSLNKQFDAKKLAAQKEAFEKTKKIKKAEAKIAFATEIANIFSTAYQLGPIAGPIVGALLAALALTRLGLNLGRIDKEQFAFGGRVPTRGGRFGGKSHSQGGTDFNYQGQTYNAEVDELAVIRTRNAAANKNYTISGNHTQIASMLNQLGGGVAFAPGAKFKRFDFGGNLGEGLQAPNFSVDTNGALELFAAGIAKLDSKTDAINSRIDRLKVVQQTSTVTDAQNKEVRQNNIAVL